MVETLQKTDGELLLEFARDGSEPAFAALVERHGAMVHGVGLRVLGDHHEAQDVCQAVFLALARKAGSLRKDPSVSGWLHHVAVCMARDVREARNRRKVREEKAMQHSSTLEPTTADRQAFRSELDVALDQLPDRYRRALTLFHLEGRSLAETAQLLNLPVSTTGTRLARAREQLRARLVRRGVKVGSVLVLISLLSAEAGAAELPATFVTATTAAAARFVAGKAGTGVGASALTSPIALLAEGVLKAMFYAKLRMAVLSLVVLLCIGAGTGWVVSQAAGAEGGGAGRDVAAGEKKPPVVPQAPRKEGVKPMANVDEKDLEAVVAGNTAFGIDLYGRLAGENPNKNLFFSPYSMSVALTMTAEGSRGETADEMGKVLHFPETARQNGADAQLLPWKTAPIHSGMHALYQRFNPKPAAPELLAQLDAKEQALKASQQQEETFQKAKNWGDYRKQTAISEKLADELNALRTQVDQYELRVANALYGERTYPFQPAFMETVNSFYGTGAAVAVDFKHNFEAVRQQINTDVADFTNQRIKDLLAKGSLDELTRLVLVNAIYFKGEWAVPFKEAETQQEDFLAGANQKVAVSMMHKDDMNGARYGAFNADGSLFATPQRVRRGTDPKTLYPGQDGFLMAELPYKGGALCMTVLVPQDAEGLDALEKKLTGANLQNWIGKLEERDVNVQLPKFKLETDYTMGESGNGMPKGLLPAMGMVRAFTDPRLSNGAQFEGMCASSDPTLRLYITKVLHKAFVEVGEKGTEAAAATAVIMAEPTSAMVTLDYPFTPTFRADKPFLFAIRDVKTGSILFLGRMVDPTK